MDCSHVRNRLFDFQEDTFPTEERKKIEQHIRSCPACARLIEGVQEFSSALNHEKAIEPNPFAGTRILQHIESELENRTRKSQPAFRRALQPALVTMGLLLALVVGYAVGQRSTLPTALTASNSQPVEMIRSDLFINDFVDENTAFLFNE